MSDPLDEKRVVAGNTASTPALTAKNTMTSPPKHANSPPTMKTVPTSGDEARGEEPLPELPHGLSPICTITA